MSYWVEVDIEILKPGKFSVRRAFSPIVERYGGSLKQNQRNINMYNLSYSDDGVHVVKDLQEIVEEAKKYDCVLAIHINSLHLF